MAVNRPRRTFRGSAVVCACRDTSASATETIRIERNFTASTLAASESDARHKLAGTRRADPARVQSPKAADRQRLRQGDIASGRHRKHGPVKDVEEFRPYLEAEPLAIPVSVISRSSIADSFSFMRKQYLRSVAAMIEFR